MGRIYKDGVYYGDTNVSVKYYDNPQDYYDLPQSTREAMTELVILNDDGNPLDASNITYGNGSNVNDKLNTITSDISTLNSTIEKKKLTISNEVWNGFFVYDKKNKTVEFNFNSINVANGSLLMRFQGNETDFIPANNKTFYGISNSNSSLNRFQIEFKNNGDVQIDCLDINANVQRGTISGIYSTI